MEAELVETEIVKEDEIKKPVEVHVARKVLHSILNSFTLQNDSGDTLTFRIRDGRPRFVLEYNRNGVDKSKVSYLERELTIPFDYGEFSTFVSGASYVISEQAKTLGVTSLYDIDKEGKKVDEKLEKAKITLRKNEESKAFELVVINHFLDNKESIFLLVPGNWHKFEMNGTIVPNVFFSKTYTINYFARLDKALEALAKENRYTYVTSFPEYKATAEIKQIN